MKQAVVIIHGIGEQQPMDTLRGFVEAVVGERAGREKYFSKPDPASELAELRRLQTVGRSGTHFYEYYWAHHVEGTRVLDVLWWLGALALRRGRDVPAGAKSLWRLARLLAVATIVLLTTGLGGRIWEWYGTQTVMSLAWTSVALVVFALQWVLVAYLGDAARYLSTAPRNIRLRNTIRREGVQLLQWLHDRGAYDRIVVVAHSLGSVIAYDILTRLWQTYASRAPGLTDSDVRAGVRAAMAAGESPQPVVRDLLSPLGEAITGPDDHAGRQRFRDAQLAAMREQQRLGWRWCISDLLTLGSPLAHAMLFMARGADDLAMRKHQRELPTCPPQRDVKGYGYSSQFSYDVGEGQRFTPLVLHHAAPFAVTRWTNLYFPAALGLFGDFVGGPLAPALGAGIRDVPVRTGAWNGLLGRTIFAHGHYWKPDAATPARAASERAARPSLEVIREVVLRRRREAYGPAPWPGAPERSDVAASGEDEEEEA